MVINILLNLIFKAHFFNPMLSPLAPTAYRICSQTFTLLPLCFSYAMIFFPNNFGAKSSHFSQWMKRKTQLEIRYTLLTAFSKLRFWPVFPTKFIGSRHPNLLGGFAYPSLYVLRTSSYCFHLCYGLSCSRLKWQHLAASQSTVLHDYGYYYFSCSCLAPKVSNIPARSQWH